eukprot:CCRYP_009907-RA/>CCRYP_009907-RA protein AED:0.25 eAED:0.25 QI:0/0/0/1/0/0/2/0/119
MYMELPKGIETSTAHLQACVNAVQLIWSKTSWSPYGFQPSLIDECVFFRDDVIFIVHVHDGIFLGPNDQSLTNAIEISAGLDIEDQGHPADSPVTITKHSNGCIEFTNALIDVIIGNRQ